jgi:hypothetical protein
MGLKTPAVGRAPVKPVFRSIMKKVAAIFISNRYWKFGVRDPHGNLSEEKLTIIAAKEPVICFKSSSAKVLSQAKEVCYQG